MPTERIMKSVDSTVENEARRYRWLRCFFARPHANKLIELCGLIDVDHGSLDAAIDAMVKS